MIDPTVASLLTTHGIRGPILDARRTREGGYTYFIEIDGADVFVEVTPRRRFGQPPTGCGWVLSMDGDRPGLIGHGCWRSLGATLRAAQRAIDGRHVRIPTGRRSGLHFMTTNGDTP